MLTEASTYDELYRNFRWDIPARLNLATVCCDRYADGSGRLALIYVDEDDATVDRQGRLLCQGEARLHADTDHYEFGLDHAAALECCAFAVD